MSKNNNIKSSIAGASTSEQKRALLAKLLADKKKKASGQKKNLIVPVQRNDKALPLSFPQQRLWFLDQLYQGSPEYNMPMAVKVVGHFDVNIAQQAISQIITRHEILRTRYCSVAGTPSQIIDSEFDFAIGRYDVSQLDDEQAQLAVDEYVDQDRRQAFDLSNDLMVRVTYIQLPNEQTRENDGILLFNMHHIASDGWSLGVLLKEFVSLYQSILEGVESSLPKLSVQYGDYACWQRNFLKGNVLDKQLDYWAKQLSAVPSVHSLPLDFTRPVIKASQGASCSQHISLVTLNALKALASNHEMTLFMLFHSALALVFARHSNSHDVVIGTPVANRMQSALEPLIGFFVNTLVLRVDTD